MFSLISLTLQDFVENDLGFSADQKKVVSNKHKLTLSDSLDKGHWTTNLCLIAANLANKSPRDLAESLSKKLEALPAVISVEVAGPGFVNIFLNQSNFLEQCHELLNPSFHSTKESKKIQVEFVSANPTGPLHVGHGRGAAYGDAISRILRYLGHQVKTEYYVNDAGRQMDILASSIFLRKFCCFEEDSFPKAAYKGSYIQEIADSIFLTETPDHLQVQKITHELPEEDEEKIDTLIERIKADFPESWKLIKDHGLTIVTESIKTDLKDFKVEFDEWFYESSLGELSDKSSAISLAMQKVQEDHAYEKEGAIWLESSKFGDDKDRVIVRDDGRGTYLSSDLAYHKDKLDRGFDQIINVWGSDHHGYIKRIEASIEAMGYSKKRMTVQLVQFANLFDGGQKVKMSTRSGNFYTLKQLLEDIGPGATRFYYLSKQADQHLDFDIGVARTNSKDNLYYYVQYAHARICSIESKYKELGHDIPQTFQKPETFKACDELLQLTLNFQFVVKSSGENMQPHLLIYYLRDLAQAFHHFYNEVNILKAPPEDQGNMMHALSIVKQVIGSALEVIGIEPLEKM